MRRGKRTGKEHPFDRICKEHGIEHRTIAFRHPWTEGMIERFNGRMKEKVLKRYLFESIFEMSEKLMEFVEAYNFHTRLRGLGYRTPAEYLREEKGIELWERRDLMVFYRNAQQGSDILNKANKQNQPLPHNLS